MTKKPLKFSINQLIIGGAPFNINNFQAVKNSEVEKFEISSGTNDEKEILHIKRVVKNIIENRFITIYFNMGDKYPYSPKVISPDLKEYDNPRSPDEIELDKQFFVLVDVLQQRILMSDQRKKETFIAWLHEKIKKEITIKSIIQEENFIKKLKSINKILFSIAPNLFNSGNEDILSKNLIKDIFGFGAEKARIEFEYNNAKITESVIKKFKALIGRKDEFDEMVVIGRSDENFESIFNLSEIINKVSVEVYEDNESKLLNPEDVFGSLIDKLK